MKRALIAIMAIAAVSVYAQDAPKKKSDAPRPERRPHSPANDDNRSRERRRYHQNDDGPTPIGFGEDIPAFMLITSAIK